MAVTLEQDSRNDKTTPDWTGRWLMGVVAALISSGFVLWLTTTNAAIVSISERELKHGNEIAEIKGQIPIIINQLGRIETKLDSFIYEQQRSQHE